MTEPTPDSDAELANDYVDATLDAPARDRVAASAALVAAVDAQRNVRAALGVLPAAPAAVRAAALAAAAAEFERRDPPVRSSNRPVGAVATTELGARRHRRRVGFGTAAGAAAAAVVAVVAVVTVLNLRDSSSDSSSAATAPTTAPFSIEAAAPAAAPDGSVAQRQTTAQTDPGGAAADSRTADQSAADGPAAKADDDGSVSIVEPAGLLTLARRTAAPAGTAAPGPPPSITSSASGGGSAETAGSSAPDGSQCLGPDDALLAHIVYRSLPAVAVVDDRRHVRRALDAATCVVLAEIAEPS